MNRTVTRTLVLGLLVGAVLAPTALWAELPPLIPRDVLFGNPEKTNPQISPDAQRLAWLAPDQPLAPGIRREPMCVLASALGGLHPFVRCL